MKGKNKYYLICVLIITIIVAVFFVEPPPSFLFQNAQGDCSGRSIFMYNALYTDKQEVDVVLFGSSKTLNGINDSMLNRMSQKTFLNLGYCRFGRNLDWFFIEEYCKNHHPEKLVLEVRQQEKDLTHPLTPYLMPFREVAESGLTLNKDFISDLYNKWLCNLKYLRSLVFMKNSLTLPMSEIKGGFWQGNGKPTATQLNTDRQKDSLSMLNQICDTVIHTKVYFEKLKKLCNTKRIELYFLYLSNYGNVKQKPDCYNAYKKYGTVICLPDSLLQKPSDFSDLGHFNLNGANKVSLWLARQL